MLQKPVFAENGTDFDHPGSPNREVCSIHSLKNAFLRRRKSNQAKNKWMT